MKLAIVDIEATTPDAKTARILEVACCVWSSVHRSIETVFSTTVAGETENPAVEINHIPPALLADATSIERAFASIGHFVQKADVIAAHNGDSYDREVFERHACSWTTLRPWLDTMDCEWPRPSSRSLLAIAHAHGVQIGSLHRAPHDVLLLADLLTKVAEMGHDVESMITRAMRPKATYRALVTFNDRDKAKAAGFHWDGDRKIWHRRLAIEDVTEKSREWGFDLEEVAA